MQIHIAIMTDRSEITFVLWAVSFCLEYHCLPGWSWLDFGDQWERTSCRLFHRFTFVQNAGVSSATLHFWEKGLSEQFIAGCVTSNWVHQELNQHHQLISFRPLSTLGDEDFVGSSVARLNQQIKNEGCPCWLWISWTASSELNLGSALSALLP